MSLGIKEVKLNSIEIEFIGAERSVTVFSPVVPQMGNEVYLMGYYYTVIGVEYYITDSREQNHKLEAIVKLQKT